LDLNALSSADPFLHQAAVWGLLQSGQYDALDWTDLADARQRWGLLEAFRWRFFNGGEVRDDLIRQAITDQDASVRLYAVRWIADAGRQSFRGAVEQLLTDRATTPALFQACLATLEWLDQGQVNRVKNPSYQDYLLRTLLAEDRPVALRAMALRLLPPAHRYLTIDHLRKFASSDQAALQREAVRSAALRSSEDKYPLLASLAGDEELAVTIRADAVMGLAGKSGEYRGVLERLAESDHGELAAEARRGLRSRQGDTPGDSGKPSAKDVDGWLRRLDEAPGDPETGWRIFFGAAGGKCGGCHRYEGRGADIGPDLTSVTGRMTRDRLLQSILQPSREIAPQFVPWLLVTDDGRIRTGLSLGVSNDGRSERFIDSEGQEFTLDLETIEARRASSKSIMPEGLQDSLTIGELRDLLALLSSD
jgi:putative heme-binding domain-containing protein